LPGLALPALLLVCLTGCSTMGTLQGARPVEPGKNLFQASVSLQNNSNPLSTALDMPLPQLQLGYRRGLAPDVDLGARIYLLGLFADVRYRFLQRGPLHLALDPGLGLFALPIPGNAIGNVDFDLPLLAEIELNPHLSLVLCARSVARQHFAWIDDPDLGSGTSGRYELLGGGGSRLDFHFKRLRFGFYGDVLVNTTRRGPLWWDGGADFGFVTGKGKASQEGEED